MIIMYIIYEVAMLWGFFLLASYLPASGLRSLLASYLPASGISYRIYWIGLGRKFSWMSGVVELFLDICSKLSSCAINPELIGVCL
jgi:hypothetical protein